MLSASRALSAGGLPVWLAAAQRYCTVPSYACFWDIYLRCRYGKPILKYPLKEHLRDATYKLVWVASIRLMGIKLSGYMGLGNTCNTRMPSYVAKCSIVMIMSGTEIPIMAVSTSSKPHVCAILPYKAQSWRCA